ncbi:hypothetical protein [Sphingomonas pokkalii]|uniref:hypothetical protein n=1 Tax=Sphingomonas pokkalii TaxID=2175090 RepID=UPI0010580811|nr:hypothetical protein [Sphingomonas pokkalii]
MPRKPAPPAGASQVALSSPRTAPLGAAADATPPIDYVCEHCGAPGMTRDAWAEWSTTEQRWQLTTLFDFAFCHMCHRPTRLVVHPLRKG